MSLSPPAASDVSSSFKTPRNAVSMAISSLDLEASLLKPANPAIPMPMAPAARIAEIDLKSQKWYQKISGTKESVTAQRT